MLKDDNQELLIAIADLSRRVAALERRPTGLTYSDASTSSPPTDAQLDAAFGLPSGLGPFVAILDIGGAGSTVYLVMSDGAFWWYEQLTKAT